MIEELAPFLVGKDPTRIELLYEQLYRMNFWIGTTELTAISAVEMACWDILGKSLNAPVYKLLGGAYRDRIRLYAHVHPEGERTPAGFAAGARGAGRAGLRRAQDDRRPPRAWPARAAPATTRASATSSARARRSPTA